jgi:3-hydroxybutyryl-CoA dehydratase
MTLRGRTYSSLEIGEEFWDALTLTETHVTLASGIFNDPGPNHVNHLQAAASRWGTPIVHGTLLSGIMMGVLGNPLGANIVAMLELTTRWHVPTRVGDTLIGHWHIAEKIDKPRFDGGGLVIFEGEGLNQDAVKVMDARVVLAVGEEAPWDPAAYVAERRPA